MKHYLILGSERESLFTARFLEDACWWPRGQPAYFALGSRIVTNQTLDSYPSALRKMQIRVESVGEALPSYPMASWTHDDEQKLRGSLTGTAFRIANESLQRLSYLWQS